MGVMLDLGDEAAAAEAAVRLNWIDLPESSRDLLPQLDALSAKHRDKTTNILCGMGGSSLGPEVIAQTFQRDLFMQKLKNTKSSLAQMIPLIGWFLNSFGETFSVLCLKNTKRSFSCMKE